MCQGSEYKKVPFPENQKNFFEKIQEIFSDQDFLEKNIRKSGLGCYIICYLYEVYLYEYKATNKNLNNREQVEMVKGNGMFPSLSFGIVIVVGEKIQIKNK